MLRQMVDGFIYAIFIVFTLTLLIIAPILLYGQEFEMRYMPVVVEATVENAMPPQVIPPALSGYESPFTWYRVRFDKKRQCQPIDSLLTWFIVRADGTQERVGVSLPDDHIKDSSRPLGKNLTDPWRVDNRGKIPFVSQRLVVVYRCHFLWNTLSVINIPIGIEK